MQESAGRAVVRFKIELLVYELLRFSIGGIKPVGDVRASSKDNRVAERTRVVLSDEFSQVVDLVEQRNPAVISGVVLGHFRGEVKPPNFVLRRQVLKILLVPLLSRNGSGHLGSGDSCSSLVGDLFVFAFNGGHL